MIPIFQIPTVYKWIAYALIIASAFGSGYYKGKRAEKNDQNELYISALEKNAQDAYKQAIKDRENLALFAKQRDKAIKDNARLKTQLESLMKSDPVYEECKIGEDVKAQLNEMMK